jgi:hypothetical protein
LLNVLPSADVRPFCVVSATKGTLMKKENTSPQDIEAVIDSMAAKWPSSVVSRRAIPQFTGGLYSSKFMANEDCKKAGPIGGFTIGGQKVYPVQSVIEWLKSRASGSWAERKSA